DALRLVPPLSRCRAHRRHRVRQPPVGDRVRRRQVPARRSAGTVVSRESRFEQLVADTSPDLLAFALRRAKSPEDAADVVAETFLIAWRKLDKLPPGAEARLWLFGVAQRAPAHDRQEPSGA